MAGEMTMHLRGGEGKWRSAWLGAMALVWQLALLTGALGCALWFQAGATAQGSAVILFAVTLATQALVWLAMGLHSGIGAWRYTGFRDIRWLCVAVVLGSALSLGVYNLVQISAVTFRGAPLGGTNGVFGPALFVLDALFALLFVGGVRIAARLLYEESRPIAVGGMLRLLIVGAGDAAGAVLREIARLPEQRYRVVGLLDDEMGRAVSGGGIVRAHGVRVLGKVSDLPRLCRERQIGEILIAIPSATSQEMQRIVAMCRTAQMESSSGAGAGAAGAIRFRTVPSLQDILAGTAATQIRDVSVTDVLGRDAVDMDLAAVGALIHEQVVVVSGAGGSIGSELCRTICRFEPAHLVLLDKAENAVFEIERELRKRFPAVAMSPVIGDISDAVRVEQVFADYAPGIVFHAAAHKHVPLAESNPGEAIRNNVFGTKILADAALVAGVKNFVMISTDKAVNPSSIMGATKRCAEMYIQSLTFRGKAGGGNAERRTLNAERRASTNFITVRFGNVLGSNGSVVPIFKQQIAAGGPVTVTHPEMRRYFMTIPEASQLVLQAGALGQRGEIFVLDMGKPVRILDLARDLIIMSGLRPDVDIPIVFTGLRPGEKLYEELSIRGENMAATRHAKIAVWKSAVAESAAIHRMMDELEPLQHCTDRERVLRVLKAFVPEMVPWEGERETRKAECEMRKGESGG